MPQGHTTPIEFEAKVLDIDPTATEQRILKAGGQWIAERFMRRYVYDVSPGDTSRWIRLRDSGSEVTLTVKQITTDAIDGTHEAEVVVNDFGGTHRLLGMMGFTPKSYQENRRTSFTLDNVELEIDTWPHLPPYLEIEADSTAVVIRVAGLLGYTETDLTGENTIKIYAHHRIDLNAVSKLTFD